MRYGNIAVTITTTAAVVFGYSPVVKAQSQNPAHPSENSSAPSVSESLPAPSQPQAARSTVPAAADGATGSQPQGEGETASTAATSPPPPVPAASSAGDQAVANDAGTGIATVVVTARRTAENLQKVPVAVTAFSAKDLERQQIKSAQDLNGVVPSLVVSTGSTLRNSETPTIRGQGATFGASPGVVIYYAEVPLPSDFFNNQQGGPGKFFDLADLQVLKGAQGTLFGRNTTGGALVLEPHKPDPAFEASLKSELGNFEARGAEGILNVPVIEDQLFLRLGAKYYERGGFTENIATGAELDSRGFRTFRLGLMWKPTDGIQNYLLGYYTHSADNGTSQVLEQINRTVTLGPINVGCAAVAASAASVEGHFATNYTNCGSDIVAAQQARGVRAVDLSTSPDDILDTGGAIDNFNYEISDALTLRNIASYQTYKHHYRWDEDGSNLPLNDFNNPDDSNSSDFETYTEELQVQGRAWGGGLKYVGGVYYQYLQPTGVQQNLGLQLGLIDTRASFDIKTRSYGPYAQATYDMGTLVDALDGLNVTAGARYTSDDSSGTATSGSYFTGAPNPLFRVGGVPISSSVKNSAPTYTFGVDYKVPTTMLYAKVSRGYKSGGISPQAVTPSRYTYMPEFVLNYEIGSKSDFRIGDVPARINSALYYTDYTDIQKTATDNNGPQFGAATINAAKASISGFETDITMQPLEGLTVVANYSFTYAKYGDFTLPLAALTPQEDCTGQKITNGGTMQLQCVPFNYVPRHQGSLTARYQLPIAESLGTIEGSATYSFIDRQYTSPITVPDAEPGAWLGAYGLLNASLNWSSIYRSAFDLQMFGANLTDRTYRISNSDVWNFLYFQSSIYGEPRTFGLSLSYRWGE